MKPFLPPPLPLAKLDAGRLLRRVGQASAALARYDGTLRAIINPAILLAPLTTQEAVLSSRIEGTVATLSEVLELGGMIEERTELQKDIREILNYRRAMGVAIDSLRDRPLSLHLIRELHAILLDSVRGRHKNPGSFREGQNFVGPPGAGIERASYVPPDALTMRDRLDNLEAYLRRDDEDPLVQTAIVHAQFELIHPFADGNGRIGRLLIPLQLHARGFLATPMFYVSAYLEAHRDAYYDALAGLSARAAWDDWIEFFLVAVIEQAQENQTKASQILSLHELSKRKLRELHSEYAAPALDSIFEQPIFTSSEFLNRLGIPRQTALRLLDRLEKIGIIETLRPASGRRPALLGCMKLIDIAQGRAAEAG